MAASGFTEAVYDANGIRREPRLKVLWPQRNLSTSALGSDDLLLVTGGGKGITAECALTLARSSGCRLALLGRSHPDRDEELRNNLQRFRSANVVFEYFAVDLTDERVASGAIQRIQSELGTVTAVLHGAGVNNPKPLTEIAEEDLRVTLEVKVTALRNILKFSARTIFACCLLSAPSSDGQGCRARRIMGSRMNGSGWKWKDGNDSIRLAVV